MVPKALIFDLDEVLLDQRRAWQYTLEESVAMVCDRRIDASALVAEYRGRPWHHAVGVLVDGAAERMRCSELCVTVFERSALKRLLVHEGIGMALDAVRAARIEMGAISRSRHNLALKQVHSTGLDRFLAVLATTGEGETWEPGARFEQCLRFLERQTSECAFVGADEEALCAVAGLGACAIEAGWAVQGSWGFEHFELPSQLWPGIHNLA